MYTEFLKGLAALSEKLDEAVKIGGEVSGMPTPYLSGTIDVSLDGEKVGRFKIEDEYVVYESLKPS